MLFETVAARIDGLPFTRRERGRRLYDFVLRNGIQSILELGCYHGVSTLYMAAALHELGSGSVVTLDRLDVLELSPSITELASELGLEPFVRLIAREEALHFTLRDLLRQQFDPARGVQPLFDFAFLDAGHEWRSTGFSFYLVELLVRPGGWLLFDDLGWIPQAERSNPEAVAPVGEIVELLVKTHPHISFVMEDRRWCWARKNSGSLRPPARAKRTGATSRGEADSARSSLP